MQQYLSVCAIYRNEADYLREWIEFHKLVGVSRFFLYDNQSTDQHRQVLAPYVADGTVAVYDWPLSPGQEAAYDHCLREHGEDSRWIAFIDLDEFLFSPTGSPVAEILRQYEDFPAVGVHWAVYGSSGHQRRPEGLLIESFLHRTENRNRNKWIKSIVDPARTVRALTAHAFAYEGGCIVDENRCQIGEPGLGRGWTDTISFSKLRINHYWIKSHEEWQRKAARPWPTRDGRRPHSPGAFERFDKDLNQVLDDSITRYTADLRRALAAAETRAQGSVLRPPP